jgi:hypothetical protein
MTALGVVKPNPPISGHHLLNEGHTLHAWRGPQNAPFEQYAQVTTGGCQCGEHPTGWPEIEYSARSMKAWHRNHKSDLRGGSR